MNQIRVYKGRTTILPVSFGFDVSLDTFESEIRVDPDRSSPLIAEWDVSFTTDGTDGEILLRLDDSVTSSIIKNVGYMDIKRISSGEALNVLDNVLEVLFKETVTD